jgi:hypothetical protein
MRLRQGCSLSPTLLNIFIDDLMSKLDKAHTHSHVMNQRQVAELFSADDVAVAATIKVGLQRVKDFYKERSLKINVDKTKVSNI